jgi:hypothetical protein
MTPAPILAAERALGRLDHALSEPATHSLWLPDALRREAIASRQIDGDLVALEDFATARLHSSTILREDIQRAIDLAAAAERWLGIEAEAEVAELTKDGRLAKGKRDHILFEGDKAIITKRPVTPFDESILPELDEDTDFDPIEGLDAGEDLVDLADEPLDYDVILARTKANIAALKAESAVFATPPKATIPPLSTPWLTLAWARIIGTPDSDDLALLENAADLIDAALQVPGLPGAFGAMWALQQDIWPARAEARWVDISKGGRREHSAEEMARRAAMSDAIYNEKAEGLRADQEWSLIRLMLPWLIQRTCGLERPGPWLSSIMAARGHDDMRRVYWSAQSMPKDRWISAMAEIASKGFAAEVARIDTLKARLVTWEGLAGTRASKSLLGKVVAYKKMERVPSKIIKALPLLIEQSVVNAPWWARRRGIGLRMAQRQLADLALAGVLDDITGDQRAEKVFMGRGLS